MRLLCKFNGIDGVIVGYCPNSKGIPQAIVLCKDSKLYSASLSEIEVSKTPRKLRKLHVPKSLKEPKAKRELHQ